MEEILDRYSSSFRGEAAQDASAGWAFLVLVWQALPQMWEGYRVQASKWCRATASMNPTGCQVYINPHHLHPLFTDGRGTGRMSLQRQAALLFLKRNNITIHRLLGVNHKAIEDMETRLRSLGKKYVEVKEKEIEIVT